MKKGKKFRLVFGVAKFQRLHCHRKIDKNVPVLCAKANSSSILENKDIREGLISLSSC